MSMKKVLGHVDKNMNVLIKDLCVLIQQPSVSAKNLGIKKCANLVKNILKKSGINAEILSMKDYPPIVYGEMKSKKNSNSFDNISFILDDAEKFKLDSKFDCITGSYLPKYCDPEILVKNCVAHLKPGGKIIFHDFTYPKNPAVRGLWNFFLTFLRLVGCFIPSWKDALIGLPKLIRRTKWLDSYSDVMKKSGLKVSHQYLTYGAAAILTGTK